MTKKTDGRLKDSLLLSIENVFKIFIPNDFKFIQQYENMSFLMSLIDEKRKYAGTLDIKTKDKIKLLKNKYDAVISNAADIVNILEVSRKRTNRTHDLLIDRLKGMGSSEALEKYNEPTSSITRKENLLKKNYNKISEQAAFFKKIGLIDD